MWRIAADKALLYVSATSDNLSLTGISVTLPYNDRMLYNDLADVLEKCDFDEEYIEWLEKFCKANGLPFYGLHSLRHFFASSLIHANVDLAAVSSALGHSDPSITNSIYLHYFQDANARAGDAIASVLDFSPEKNDKPKELTDDMAS